MMRRKMLLQPRKPILHDSCPYTLKVDFLFINRKLLIFFCPKIPRRLDLGFNLLRLIVSSQNACIYYYTYACVQLLLQILWHRKSLHITSLIII